MSMQPPYSLTGPRFKPQYNRLLVMYPWVSPLTFFGFLICIKLLSIMLTDIENVLENGT